MLCASFVTLGSTAIPALATPAGSNGPLIYSEVLDQGGGLFKANPDGTGREQIDTSGARNFVSMSVSADGHTLVGDADGPAGTGIYKVDLANGAGAFALVAIAPGSGWKVMPRGRQARRAAAPHLVAG
ncbi:MAG: hypothetical protein JWR63_196 [Conexibacter sp.]|nr:hypothetical protein [Conexibacter sp.]